MTAQPHSEQNKIISIKNQPFRQCRQADAEQKSRNGSAAPCIYRRSHPTITVQLVSTPLRHSPCMTCDPIIPSATTMWKSTPHLISDTIMDLASGNAETKSTPTARILFVTQANNRDISRSTQKVRSNLPAIKAVSSSSPTEPQAQWKLNDAVAVSKTATRSWRGVLCRPAPQIKGPRRGPIQGGEGGMDSAAARPHPCGAPRPRSQRPKPLTRFCRTLRGFSAVLHSQIKKGPRLGPFFIWRRRRDSNPRYGITVNTISSRALSTTQPPLQNFPVLPGCD